MPAARKVGAAGLPVVDEGSLIGSSLGNRYRLVEVIGEGGVGRVFRAERLATGQMIALKLLHAEYSAVEQVVQRFEREAKVLTQLSHQHIVKVIEFGEWNGRFFLAMDLLEGKSLAHLIGRKATASGQPLTPKRAVAIMRPVFDALEYAHGRGVIHRDLKPDNIMVIPGRGTFSRECVKLLDFGIAKLENDAEAKGQKLTQLGLLLGTPGYMSPEQAIGMKADARSDLYACGVILYEMLTGRRPFEADSSLDLMSMQLNATTQSLQTRAAAAGIPAAFEAVVLRALAKRPEERFQSAREFRQAVDRAAGVRGGNADVSGVGKTVLAASSEPRRGPRWIRLATIAVATAMLIGDHVKPQARHGERVIAGAVNGSPSQARPRHSSPAISGESSDRINRNVNPTRATGKKSPVRKR